MRRSISTRAKREKGDNVNKVKDDHSRVVIQLGSISR